MKRFVKSVFALGVAVLAFAACEKNQEPVEEPVKYTLSGDNAFTNMEATVKVTADKAATADVQVTITLDKATSFPQDVLEFPGTVKIAKGAKEASAKVKLLSTDALEPGNEYKAVFGAAVADVALSGNVTITYTKPDLNGKWSVIGLGSNWNDDIAMTEAGNGWYEATGLVAKDNDEFKFRRDGAWDLAYGLAAAGTPELDTEFAVTDAPGSPNIGIAAKGVYTLSVNPNAKLAKIVKTGLAPITLAEIAALATADGAPFAGAIKDVVVTYVSGSNTFVTDGESNLLIYVKGLNLPAGSVLNGEVEGTVKDFNGLPEISAITSDFSRITVTEGTAPEPETMTVAQILANFDKIISKRVKVTGLSTAADIQKKGTYTVAQGTDEIKFYTYDLKNTIEAGSTFDVVGIVTPFKTDKQIKIFEEASISNVVAPVKELTFERVWGKYPTEWPTFTNNLDRNAAIDDEYVYVVKAGAGAKGVTAISLTDPSKQKDVCMDGVNDEGTFYTSCVKTILNPTTGKKILLMSNLALEGGVHLYLYAYDKGIDQAPTVLLKDYTVPTWASRRFGDFFTVVGDWNDGYVWFRTNTEGASTTARFKLVNGALASQVPDGFNYGYGASQGKGAFYQMSMKEKTGLLITSNIGMFYDLNSAEGQTWGQNLDNSVFKNHFGFTPFEYEGQSYLAFTKMYNAARAWLTIIKTTGDYKADLETYAKDGSNIAYQEAIQIEETGPSTNVMAGATYSDQSTGSCDVVVNDKEVYIMGHLHNVGLSVFKLYMK